MTVKIVSSPHNFKVYSKIENLAKQAKKGIRQAHYKIGKDLIGDVRESLDQPKMGRVYLLKKRSSKRLVRHRASAPYEPPANFNRDFNRSLNYKLSGYDKLVFGSADRAGSIPVPYGVWLEEGTRRMEPRPWGKPAIQKNIRNMQTHYETEIKKAFNQNSTP